MYGQNPQSQIQASSIKNIYTMSMYIHRTCVLMDNNVKGIRRGQTGKLVYHPIIMEATQVSLLTTTFMRGSGACYHITCYKRSHT